MNTLTPKPSLDPVPQLERSTAALGGPGGPMNIQAQALLNRIEYVKQDLEVKVTASAGGGYGYKTYALMDADKGNIKINASALVSDDPDTTKNGEWTWDGAIFTKSKYDPLQQSKAYTELHVAMESDALFKRVSNPMNNASMPVTRFMTDGSSNSYAYGTYQTAIANGVSIAVLASGSNGIKHYFNTGKIAATFIAEFTINTIRTATSGEGIGVGFLKDGVNEVYVFTESGNILKLSNNLSVNIATGLGGYVVGDKVKFVYKDGKLNIYHNNVLKGTMDVSVGVSIIVGQIGFSSYSVSVYESASDPVREYVQEQILSSGQSALKSAYYSYDSESQTFKAYTQIKDNLYVGFEVRHEVDMRDLIYQDYWRIYQALFYRLDGGVMQPTGKIALGLGESEFVFKQISSKDDFTGGYHGDEIVTDIKILVDGIPISTASNIALSAARKIEYIEKSTMHETAEAGVFVPGHPVIAYHTKHTEFKGGGYKTHNVINWNYTGTLSTLYHGIACISKDVATKVFADDTYTDQMMTSSGNNYFNAIGARLYKGRNEANGLAVEASAYQQKVDGADALSELFVHDRSTDSKYYRKSPARNITTGEVHESYFECFFFSLS